MEEPELPLPSNKKEKKPKVILMNEAGKDKLQNPLLITLACCLMMARRLHVCKMNLNLPRLGRLCL